MALEDGTQGGSSRNPRRIWFTTVPDTFSTVQLPDISGTVERALYAGQRFVVQSKSPIGGRQLSISDSDGSGTQPLAMGEPELVEDGLLLSFNYAGVLQRGGAQLYHIGEPVRLVNELRLSVTPASQLFTTSHWWLMAAEDRTLRLTCRDLRGNTGDRTLNLEITGRNLLRPISSADELIVVDVEGGVARVASDDLAVRRSQIRLPDGPEPRVIGAAFVNDRLALLMRTSMRAHLELWSPDSGELESLNSMAAGPAALVGPAAGVYTVAYHNGRTAWMFNMATGQTFARSLPAAAEIVQLTLICCNDGDAAAIRKRLAGVDSW
ncbi:MAG TPA: hypothetical protein VGS41_09895, partial [Chthonomonadales bacterium]|nr:hypothetical protein [Chthonomonadales bacterium]